MPVAERIQNFHCQGYCKLVDFKSFDIFKKLLIEDNFKDATEYQVWYDLNMKVTYALSYETLENSETPEIFIGAFFVLYISFVSCGHVTPG